MVMHERIRFIAVSAVVRVSNRHQRHHATFRNLSHLFLYCVRQRVCVCVTAYVLLYY